MKRIAKIFSLLCIVFAMVLMASCGNSTDDNKGNNTNGIAPTYLGVKIEKVTTTAKLMSYKAANPNKGNNNTEGNNGWHGKKDNSESNDNLLESEYEEILKNDIAEVLDIKVVTDDSVKYFVNPEEIFIIVVELENPSDYEIQSFTLNGKKYANYMFEDNSDMENLYLKVTAPSESGYVDYTIDAIKYIDGTEIKDVDLSSGNQTIKAGVKYADNITANIVDIKSTPTTLEFDVNLSDQNNLSDDVAIYLSDGEKIVGNKKLTIGNNKIVFDSLMVDKKYQYIITSTYDLCDGNYNSLHTLAKDFVCTDVAYDISSVTSTNVGISFMVNCNDSNISMSKLDLYVKNGDDITFVKSGQLSDRAFDELLSNNTYIISLEYEYSFEGKNTTMFYAYEISTLAKTAPVLEYGATDYTKDSIVFDYTVTDADEICTIEKYELYLGEELKATITDLDVKTFADLLSNNEYTIKVLYSYDLNDGTGVHNESIIKYIQHYMCLFNYEESTHEATITYLKYDVEHLIIPEKIYKEGVEYIVTSSYYQNFMDNQDLITVSLPSTLKEIPTGMFRNCNYLSSIDFGENPTLKSIGSAAFLDCNLGDIVIPASVEIIKSACFRGNPFKKVSFENGSKLKTIESTAFYCCYNLEIIELPEGLEVIGEIAFARTKLKYLILPASVTKISKNIVELYSSDFAVYCLSDGAGERWNANWNNGANVYYAGEWHIDENNNIHVHKRLPSVSLELESKQTLVLYDVSILDEDLSVEKVEIRLYYNSNIIKTNSLEDDFKFEQLTPYSNYELELYVEYDLDDGNGTVSKELKYNFMTLPFFEGVRQI